MGTLHDGIMKIKDGRRILIIDIERLPGQATVQHRGLTISGPFWDLNSWKHTIGRRIHPDDVHRWPSTICAAWAWYGKPKVHFVADWSKGGHDRLLRETWEAYDRAHVVVGHNLAGFDTKKLRTDWLEAGYPPPSPVKTVDTLKIARREFGAESNTLNALTERFGITSKSDKYDAGIAEAALSGDREAQRRLAAYNRGDIVATAGLYEYLRPWDPSHPHPKQVNAGEALTCNSCWGGNLEPNGYTLASLYMYRLYRCLDCGANVQESKNVGRAAYTRGSR